jgi:hypothetical protein
VKQGTRMGATASKRMTRRRGFAVVPHEIAASRASRGLGQATFLMKRVSSEM